METLGLSSGFCAAAGVGTASAVGAALNGENPLLGGVTGAAMMAGGGIDLPGPAGAGAGARAAGASVDEALPGLPASAPKPLGLGSTGRTVPQDLAEQLAMTQVRSAPAGVQIRGVARTDPRWPAADGWVKMQQVVNGVNIHYVRNTVTGAVDDFKFVGSR